MACTEDYTASDDVLHLLSEQGLGSIPEVVRILINAAMVAERQKFLGVGAYERSESRVDRANGFKPKTVATRMGSISFDVPQVREGDFYPCSLEKGMRSERALKLAIAELYVQGVSTRKVAAVTEKLCGLSISSAQVSRVSAELDTVLEEWRQRPLGAFAYLILDARYEQVRQGGMVQSAAVLSSVGIDEYGRRHVLGVSVALSEHEVHWREFLQSLVKRGLHGVKLIVSDAHEGLGAARMAVFASVPWQRCQFHLQQNASAYVPRQDMKEKVARDIRAIFNAPDRTVAEDLLRRTVERYEKIAPKLADWMISSIPQGLTVFALPQEHQRLLRTSNMLERTNREIRRRTRVATLFPNEASCLRLVSAVLMEISEEWESGRVYLTMNGKQMT
jgi:transposase-like protein